MTKNLLGCESDLEPEKKFILSGKTSVVDLDPELNWIRMWILIRILNRYGSESGSTQVKIG